MPITAFETLCTTMPCFARITGLVPSGLDTWWITCNNLFFCLIQHRVQPLWCWLQPPWKISLCQFDLSMVASFASYTLYIAEQTMYLINKKYCYLGWTSGPSPSPPENQLCAGERPEATLGPSCGLSPFLPSYTLPSWILPSYTLPSFLLPSYNDDFNYYSFFPYLFLSFSLINSSLLPSSIVLPSSLFPSLAHAFLQPSVFFSPSLLFLLHTLQPLNPFAFPLSLLSLCLLFKSSILLSSPFLPSFPLSFPFNLFLSSFFLSYPSLLSSLPFLSFSLFLPSLLPYSSFFPTLRSLFLHSTFLVTLFLMFPPFFSVLFPLTFLFSVLFPSSFLFPL